MPKSVIWFEEANDMEEFRRDVETLHLVEIKKKYKITTQRIKQICKRNDIVHDRLISQAGSKVAFDPSREEIEQMLDRGWGKQRIANQYGVSIPALNAKLRKLGIQLEPYAGRKVRVDKHQVVDLLLQNKSIYEIAAVLDISAPAVERFCKRNNIEYKTKATQWQDTRDFLESKKEWIIQQHVELKRSIVDLIEELGIADRGVLRSKMQEWGQQIYTWKSVGRSRGELELLEYIRQWFPQAGPKWLNDSALKRELDIAVTELGVAFEYCGEHWHSAANVGVNYHKEKAELAKASGFKLMTIFEHEWKSSRDLLHSMIRSRLGLSDRVYARDCTVTKIAAREANAFHAANHIAGELKNCKLHYALINNEKIVACMSFLKARFGHTGWEIGRMSFAKGVNIVGGASKLFKFATSNDVTGKVTTYADRRFGEGDVYLKLGFEFVKTTSPGLFYFHRGSGTKYSRFACQKHNLPKLLGDKYVDSDTAAVNLERSGFIELRDCGHNLYVYDPK